MIDDVKTLISGAAGYTIPATDAALLSYLWDSEGQKIINDTNQPEVPAELDGLQTRRTAGEYIKLRKKAILGDDGAQVAKSIKEGDVSVELAGETDAERLDSLFAALTEDRGETACFRKLRW